MGCHTWFYKPAKTEEEIKRSKNSSSVMGGYIDAGYHYLFRIHTYPEDVLYSYQETVDFINKNNIETVNWELLKEFWEENPNGIIEFG